MRDFIVFIEEHFSGILLLLALICFFLFFIQWIIWLFGVGRYKEKKPGGFFRIFGDLTKKIITDFRHLFALVLVLIFAASLIYALCISEGDVDKLTKSLQTVVATLGGLIGSIIGYYFGESAARARNGNNKEE